MTDVLPTFAIVGGGFSGAMTAVQMARQATGPFVLHLIEPGEPGLGIAYSTTDPVHLLNVRADRMGALAGEPQDFMRWLGSSDAPAGHGIMPESFAPRRLYARYLRSLYAEAHSVANAKGLRIIHHVDFARAIRKAHDGIEIVLEAGLITVDKALLAIGNLQEPGETSKFPGLPADSSLLLPNAWEQDGAARLQHAAGRSTAETQIFILGTGLTTVDTMMTLERLGYRGRYRLLSRNGFLPLPHAPSALRDWDTLPDRPSGLLHRLRDLAREGAPWRGLIDGLRPHTVAYWQKLSLREKRGFLRKAFTVWNVHRHRMAPEISGELDRLALGGRLEVRSGKLLGARSRDGKVHIRFRDRDGEQTVEADYAIACVGPGYDVTRNSHPLLKQLLADRLVEPHAAGVGLAANGYFLIGDNGGKLLGIGTVLIGERLETTAVPELREQTAEVARILLQDR